MLMTKTLKRWAAMAVTSLVFIAAPAHSVRAADDVSDGVPQSWEQRSTPSERAVARMVDWLLARSRAAAPAIGSPLPESGFFLDGLDADRTGTFGAFRFPTVPRINASLRAGDEICGWTIVEFKRDKRNPIDGYVLIKSDAVVGTVELWKHLPILFLDEKPWKMQYDQWKHHASQMDAVLYRAHHWVAVMDKPDRSSDELPEQPDPPPADLLAPPPRVLEPPVRLQCRGRIQRQLGQRLFDITPLPGLDFYFESADPKTGRMTILISGTPGLSIVASPGDQISGWTLGEIRADRHDPDDVAVTLKPYGIDHTVEIWKRLAPPKPGQVLRMGRTKWERHQFEPGAERLRAEGRIVVTADSEPPSAEPSR